MWSLRLCSFICTERPSRWAGGLQCKRFVRWLSFFNFPHVVSSTDFGYRVIQWMASSINPVLALNIRTRTHRGPQTHTHQHLLQLLNSLVGHADAVDLPDLISYMQRSWRETRERSGQRERKTAKGKCAVKPFFLVTEPHCISLAPVALFPIKTIVERSLLLPRDKSTGD